MQSLLKRCPAAAASSAPAMRRSVAAAAAAPSSRASSLVSVRAQQKQQQAHQQQQQQQQRRRRVVVRGSKKAAASSDDDDDDDEDNNASSSKKNSKSKKGKKSGADKDDAFVEPEGPDAAPSTRQITNLVNRIVGQTDIAEVSLASGNFELFVRRDIGGEATAAAEAAAAPRAAATAASNVAVVTPHMSPALALAPAPYMSVDEASDAGGATDDGGAEYLLPVVSPKVGVFAKGRLAKLPAKGDQVKKGQALGFVEQLGTLVEIKAPQAGEVASYAVEIGQAVEYNQTIVELAPAFDLIDAGKATLR